MLKTLTEKIDPKHAALLVIDVQNDFCHENGACARLGLDIRPMQEMIAPLNKIIDECRTAGLLVTFVQVTHGPGNDSDVWLERHRGDPKNHNCREGTWGAQWYGIEPLPSDPIVVKHRYSAFTRTGLDDLLRARGIKTLLLTGTATDVCVESTAREGFMLDYYVVLVSDCTSTFSGEGAQQNTLEHITKFFGVVATSDELIQALSQIKRAAILHEGESASSGSAGVG